MMVINLDLQQKLYQIVGHLAFDDRVKLVIGVRPHELADQAGRSQQLPLASLQKKVKALPDFLDHVFPEFFRLFFQKVFVDFNELFDQPLEALVILAPQEQFFQSELDEFVLNEQIPLDLHIFLLPFFGHVFVILRPFSVEMSPEEKLFLANRVPLDPSKNVLVCRRNGDVKVGEDLGVGQDSLEERHHVNEEILFPGSGRQVEGAELHQPTVLPLEGFRRLEAHVVPVGRLDSLENVRVLKEVLVVLEFVRRDPVGRIWAFLLLGKLLDVFFEDDRVFSNEQISEVIKQGGVFCEFLQSVGNEHVFQVFSEGFVEGVRLVVVDRETAC